VPVQPATVRTNGSSQRPASDIGVVAVVSGEGLQRVFESLGVSAVVPGGQTMNPSTQDLLTAINSVEHDQIILLPNNSNIILTAQQAKELSSKQVLVVSTKTVPQGIAALLAFNYQASLQSNAELMQEAAKQVQTAEVTQAVRSVQVNGLSIAEGQVIGLLNDNLTTAGEDVSAVVLDLLERVHTEEREIITIYYGENISDGEARALAEEITAAYPDLEVEVHDGGQAHYYYIISVE
jgi:dihydroxyacetone kinase-like predicted kinase